MRARQLFLVAITLAACGGASTNGTPPVDPTAPDAPVDEIRALVEAYRSAHPGNGGKDWDVNTKTDDQLAADADALRLVSICGTAQRPIYPLLAWEYGGADHPWIAPEDGALAYCVYLPQATPTDNWAYDATADHVIADIYVKFPDDNPCAAQAGADQVAMCIGDASNFEILVDMASRNDGSDAGLNLSEASTELRLILGDGTKVHLIDNL